MERKQIKINPDFFSLSKRKRRKGGAKKPLFKHSLKTKDIKKNLLNRIKKHQQREKEKNIKIKTEETIEPPSIDEEFKQSLEYLNSIQKKKKKKNRQSKKSPRTTVTPTNTQIHVETPILQTNHLQLPSKAVTRKNNTLIRPDPPYGILKTGKKPLYRDYMNSLKSKIPSLVIHDSNNRIKNKYTDPYILDRQKKLKKLKKKFKVRKRRFTLGKNMKNRKIGVLIKNKTIKKKVQRQLNQLKHDPIFNVKKYLRKQGLLRIGTSAPEDVIRNIYQDSKSAGQIVNRSSDILLHNYLNESA